MATGVAAFWIRALADFFSAASASLLSLESWPSLAINGVKMHIVPDGTVNLCRLAKVWPGGLSTDWQLVCEAVGGDALRPLPPSLHTTWFDFYRFAALRLRYSSGAPGSDSLLRSLVNGMVNVTAFLVEVHVHERVRAHSDAFKDRDLAVTELLGPSNRFRCHGNVLKRLSWLERIGGMGSDEAIARALAGTSSIASMAVSARNTMYWRRSMEVFAGANRVSLGWDGSNHGGREVVCGYGADVLGRFAACCRPKDSPCHGLKCRVAMVLG